MDMMLAISILAFGPTSFRPPEKMKSPKQREQEIAKVEGEEIKARAGERRLEAKAAPRLKNTWSVRFAPEFDGLNFYETFVCR